MLDHNFINLSRKKLFKAFDKERQEWLNAGMNEADIFRIHFGDDGTSGDYKVWLDERKYNRADHKYCPGTPISLNEVFESNEIKDHRTYIEDVEVNIDLENALKTLTPQQRYCFIEVAIYGKLQESVANDLSILQSGVSRRIKLAKRNLKKYFSGEHKIPISTATL